jgi:hypothetical protein
MAAYHDHGRQDIAAGDDPLKALLQQLLRAQRALYAARAVDPHDEDEIAALRTSLVECLGAYRAALNASGLRVPRAVADELVLQEAELRRERGAAGQPRATASS